MNTAKKIAPLGINHQLTFEEERENTQRIIAHIAQARTPISLLLDGITDPKNIAMLLRLADAARLQTVFLYNCTLPAAKQLAPARAVLPYLHIQTLDSYAALLPLKSAYYWVAIERTTHSVSYKDCNFVTKTLLILGAENTGVSQPILDLADATVHLPMLGINTSMNVACAGSIVVYEALSQVLQPPSS